MRNLKILKGIRFRFWLSLRLLVIPLGFQEQARWRWVGSAEQGSTCSQGFCKKKGIDYEETFAPVARLEAIRIFFAFAASKGFKVLQMDVKSAFLNGFIDEEIYVKQPPDFENPKFPNRVYKLQKAFYGLKQAPRAWYDRLKTFLPAQGFKMWCVDKTLFLMRSGIIFY